MMAINKKLLRDFRRLWVQAAAIALVLACGVAILLTSFGMYGALDETRSAYYERNRFADVFASARRAPRSLLPEILAINGVWAIEARVTGDAILDIPGSPKSAVGHLISYPDSGDPALNVPVLRSGRMPAPDRADEVAVNEPFAQENGFALGDVFSANLNGQKRELTITGTVLSPEFIYTIGPGALMPDNQGYGILWMSERAVAAAFDMTGAFNDISLKLSPGATTDDVIDALDDILDNYGGLGAYDRSGQLSDSFIEAELTQLKGMALVLPPVFFAISAFLVGMVLGRIVALERSEIGLLKAIGYSNAEVSLHYLMLAALIASVGIGIGWVVGAWLAQRMAGMYAEFFTFPYLIFRVAYWVYGLSGLMALFATTLGAMRSALQAARLAPAIAMQPPAPPRFKHSIADYVMRWLRMSQTSIMIARSFLRWPVRSALTTFGLSLAVATLVASSFFQDSLDELIDSAFFQSNRQDAILIFSGDFPTNALEDVRRLPGVLQIEGQQYHPVILRNGHLSKRVAIEARSPGADLSRVIAADGSVLTIPPGGIVLGERLAQRLDVQVGGTVEVEFQSGRRETRDMVVTGLAEQYFGLGAYADLDFMNQLLRQSSRVSTVSVTLDDNQVPALHAAIKEIPRLTGTIMMNDTRQSFQDTISENILIMNTVYISIAVLITIGVAYNGARIQLSERARELASMRILGFTRGEVSFVLVGEIMTLSILAQPLGWLLGWLLVLTMSRSFNSDLYAIPIVLKPSTFAFASIVVLAASVVSVLIVRRRLDRFDLVSVMKTRE